MATPTPTPTTLAAGPAAASSPAPDSQTNLNRNARGGGWILPVALALALALSNGFASPFVSDLIVKVMILSVFALSLELLVGMTGLVSLGHAAFLGVGAYTTVLVSTSAGGSIGTLAALSIAAAACAALVIGALSLRTRGVYFIMVTLAFAQMTFFVFHDTSLGGGSDGIFLYTRPSWGPLDMENRSHVFYIALTVLVAVYALLAALRRSRFGATLAGIRVNEQRMRAAGYSTYGYKLAAFVIAGAIAGLAGFLIATRDAAVNPELMAWHNSGEVLLMIILGGIGHLRGAVIGAAAFTLLKEGLSTQALVGPVADHWQLALGIAIIVFVALLPHGLIGLTLRSRGADSRPGAAK